MKRSSESVLKPEDTDLTFPDWSGMDDSTSRVNADAAFRFADKYRSWFPECFEEWRIPDREKCEVEFVL